MPRVGIGVPVYNGDRYIAKTLDSLLAQTFNDFEIITRSRSVPVAVASRSDLEQLSIALLKNEIPLPKPVRLLGVSLSSLQGDDQEEPQLGLPI